MAIEGPLRDLLEEAKYNEGFPPTEAAIIKLNELAVQGIGRGGATIEAVTKIYLHSAARVIERFVQSLLDSRTALGLVSTNEIVNIAIAAQREVFEVAAGEAGRRLHGQSGDHVALVGGLVEPEGRRVEAHIQRKIALATLGAKVREQKFGILFAATQGKPDFEAAIEAARERTTTVALLFVDIDHFKSLNTRLSHALVDQTILPDVQHLLAKLVHGRGTGYRHGGEEFVLILKNVGIRWGGPLARPRRLLRGSAQGSEPGPVGGKGDTKRCPYRVGRIRDADPKMGPCLG